MTSVLRMKTETRSVLGSPQDRRFGRCCGRSSRIEARSSGRCSPAWGTSCSPLFTKCCIAGVSGSSSSIGSRMSRVDWGEDRHVKTLEFDVHARTPSGAPYLPLIDVRGLPCWPSQPLWDQLEHSQQLQEEGRDFEKFFEPRYGDRRVLQVGADFDLVILGIGIGAVPHVCREIVERDPRWRSMVDHVKTVATQAFQVWLKADTRELGWEDGAINVSGFVEPFDTWADMTHLAREENWQESPRAIAYFCNALPDLEAIPDRQRVDWIVTNRERVRRNAITFLDGDIAHLWPKARGPKGTFKWELLADPRCGKENANQTGERRFDTQFWVANVNPSDRYTLSLPGASSIVFRRSIAPTTI